jgi:L-cysteine:1D-myo-inositol 2-amino-2-deoxy-alpha-D-glucopyranoside ligase
VALRLYNTLTDAIEEFRPAGDEVRMYVCGVTPYDTTHLGHAFCYVVFDVLNRYLRFLGWRVRYIQNITDIDDDVLKRANRDGRDWKELGDENVAIHQRSLDALGVEAPAGYPRATEAVPEIIRIARDLIARGHAYEAQGNVYFRVGSDPGYGKLSRLDVAEMERLLNERGGRTDDPRKEQPLDFLLWQAAEPGQPSWESPWGPGRPGWHIECTAMAIRDLGETIDIHGGGADLIFPHHESEIAQSEAWTGKRPFSRVWMHVGMVRMDGEKMSKSLGNMVFVEQLLTRFSAAAIRLYLAGFPYREAFEYDESELRAKEALVDQLRRAASVSSVSGGSALDASPHRVRFLAALDNDLDTPTAVAVLGDLSTAILDTNERGQSVRAAQSALRTLATLVGVTL